MYSQQLDLARKEISARVRKNAIMKPTTSSSQIENASPELAANNLSAIYVSQLPVAIPTPRSTLSPSSDAALPLFALFPRLPTELRIKVWKFTLPGPRLIKVAPPRRDHAFFLPSEAIEGQFRVSCSKPVTFDVNKESREVALKKYQIASMNRYQKIKPLYLDYSTETTLVLHTCILGTIFTLSPRNKATKETFNRFKHLRLKGVCKLTNSQVDEFLLMYFKSVETLTMTRVYKLGGIRRPRSESRLKAYFENKQFTGGVVREVVKLEFMSELEMIQTPPVSLN